jgi:inosose dehydratase
MMDDPQGQLTVRVANAPVSYGVFEMTIDTVPGLPKPTQLLELVAGAGYEGVDLGPLGFFGERADLRRRLEEHGLSLAGGWVALRLTEPDGLKEDLAMLDRALDSFEAAAEGVEPRWRPKPTLADAGSDARRANPGRGKDLPEIGLDEAGWRRLADGVQQAAERCRARGLEPTFHHHACTHVEAPHEIERFLELTDVGLCLDTGHLLLGGGDPVQAIRDWGDRVNHVHVKDARLDVLNQVIAERAGMLEVWKRGAFCALGTGDVDIEGFLAALQARGYEGWLVVEQDRIPAPGESVDAAAQDQVRNRAFLRARGI